MDREGRSRSRSALMTIRPLATERVEGLDLPADAIESCGRKRTADHKPGFKALHSHIGATASVPTTDALRPHSITPKIDQRAFAGPTVAISGTGSARSCGRPLRCPISDIA